MMCEIIHLGVHGSEHEHLDLSSTKHTFQHLNSLVPYLQQCMVVQDLITGVQQSCWHGVASPDHCAGSRDNCLYKLLIIKELIQKLSICKRRDVRELDCHTFAAFPLHCLPHRGGKMGNCIGNKSVLEGL